MLHLFWTGLNFLSAICLIGGFFYLYMKYQHTYWKRRGIRSLPTHWFFGNFNEGLFMRETPGAILGRLHQCGNDDDEVLGIYIFHKPFLLLRSPELIKQILIKDFNYFPNRNFNADATGDKIGSGNLFTVRNPEWKYIRTKMSPVFSSGKVKNLFYLMLETAESLKEYLQNEFVDGSKSKPVLVKAVSAKYTNNIIASLAFGVRMNSFATPEPEFYKKAQEGNKLTIIRGVRFFLMFFFPQFSKFIAGQMLGPSTDYFRKLFWDSMDTREATKTKRGDVIDSLLELKNNKQDDTFKFEGDILLAQSAIFFVAGRESSITTITFSLAELARNPEIQTRTREEILEKIKTQGLTYESVQEMKYLYQVISETLRMYPPAPLIDRVAEADYKIPGTDIVIEKGTPVYVTLHGMHYDPRYHPDPMRFDPDRFSDERKNQITQCTYMPFGEGPRNCIAFRVGILQSAVALITILSNYEVSLHPESKVQPDPRNVFVSPPDGFKLIFTKI